MDAPIVSFNPFINSLNDTENTAKNVFKDCFETVMDALTFSSDKKGDVMKLKMCMNLIAESQKEMSTLARAATEICSLTDRSNLGREEAVTRFDQILHDFLKDDDIDENQKEQILSLQNVLESRHNPGDEDDRDSELLVTKETQSFKDPLTQRMIEEPFKSKICNHSFEKSSIMAYLATSNRKCPYSGCQSILRKEDLVFDLKLKAQILNQTKEEEDSS